MSSEIEEKYIASMTHLVFGKNSTPFRTIEEWWKAVIDELRERDRVKR
jgi:hypothetical protein